MTAKKQGQALSEGDEQRIQDILERRQTIAEALHRFTSRREAEEELAPIFTADEPTQMLLSKQLARLHDSEAADLLLAIHELAPEKTVRKEARRALIQLAGAKVYPSWTPEPETPVFSPPAVEAPPRFWKGSVAEIRESGEVELILCWEQGADYNEARLFSFLLDFWQDGVKDFLTDTGTKHFIEKRVADLEQTSSEKATEAYGSGNVPANQTTRFVDCTLAEGRRLLNEALSVNRWRKNEPHKDFRQYLPQIQRLILHAEEVGEDRGRTFILPTLDPDMIAANFAGGWSMGDYGLCYDLLSSSNPVLEKRDRDEWIEMRRNWADEAHPARFEIYFLYEREPEKTSTLWLPGSAIRSRREAEQKEVELAWSLEISDTPLSGTLPEMPMGTAVYKETRRHWFWTIFTLNQEDGRWRISSLKDEGVASQGLPAEELRKRITEHDEAIQKIITEHAEPNEAEAQVYVDEIIRRSWQTISLMDALIAKNPQDRALYEEAYGRCLNVEAVERAAVYVEALARRFPNHEDHIQDLQRLGAIQVAIGERFAQLRQAQPAAHFEALGEATLREAVQENNPLSSILLAEFLISRNKYEEAEQELFHAREKADENGLKAQIEFDLATLELDRQHFAEAQHYLEKVAELAPNYPSLWATLGFVHRNQENYPEAIVYYQRAMEEDASDVRVYSELGSIYLTQRAYTKARDVLAQGIRALPQSAHLRALMAMVYLEQNDRRRATEYLEEAERINPELEIVQAIHDLLKKK